MVRQFHDKFGITQDNFKIILPTGLFNHLIHSSHPFQDSLLNHLIHSSHPFQGPLLNHLIHSYHPFQGLSIQSSSFPDLCKIAKLIALFKKGVRYEAENYRPLSLLPLFSKIFEKVVHIQTEIFFNDNKILVVNQSAFRPSQLNGDFPDTLD